MYLFALIIFLLAAWTPESLGRSTRAARAEEGILNLHAANLYRLAYTLEKEDTEEPRKISHDSQEYLTANCILGDKNDLIATSNGGAVSSEAAAHCEDAIKTLDLADYLWVSEETTAVTTAVIARLKMGPFQGETVAGEKTGSIWSGVPHFAEDDETDTKFRLSIYVGENTNKLCFSVSLYKRLEDIGRLSKAIMNWTPSYSTPCKLKMSSFMEAQLNFTKEHMQYSLQDDPFGHEDDQPDVSCRLSNVDRYDFVFSPSDVIARPDPYCSYTDEGTGVMTPTGAVRIVDCSLYLAVQFRPSTAHLTPMERHMARLRLSAAVTLFKDRTGSIVDGGDGDGNGNAGSSDDQDEATYEPIEDIQAPDSSSSSGGADSSADDIVAVDLNPFSIDDTTGSQSQAKRFTKLQRCATVGVAQDFWNVTLPNCVPPTISPTDMDEVQEEVVKGDKAMIILLVTCSCLVMAAAFMATRKMVFAASHRLHAERYIQ